MSKYVSPSDIRSAPIDLSACVFADDALKELCAKKIKAAPVIDGNAYVGVFGLADCMRIHIEKHRVRHLDPGEQAKQDLVTTKINADRDAILKRESQLSYLARMRKFHVLDCADSALELAELIGQSHCHLVGLKCKGELEYILSQHALFRAIVRVWRETGALEGHAHAHPVTLKNLFDAGKVVTRPVHSVRASTPCHAAFASMTGHLLSALPVVNRHGKLVHNLSLSDAKAWLATVSNKIDHFLDIPVEQFLVHVRSSDRQIEKTRYPAAFANLETTLFKEAIFKLVATGYHRLWVCDKNHRPIGCLSVSDILGFVRKPN